MRLNSTNPILGTQSKNGIAVNHTRRADALPLADGIDDTGIRN